MFNIGGSEMVVLGILALLVFGPEGLPGIIKNVMRTVNAVKAAARDFQTEVSTVLNDEHERQDLAKRQRKPFVEPEAVQSPPPSQSLIGVTGEPAPNNDSVSHQPEMPVDESANESNEPAELLAEDDEADTDSVSPAGDGDGPGVPVSVDCEPPQEETASSSETVQDSQDESATGEVERPDLNDDDGPRVPMKMVRPRAPGEEATEVS